jgi:Na+/proline symporter
MEEQLAQAQGQRRAAALGFLGADAGGREAALATYRDAQARLEQSRGEAIARVEATGKKYNDTNYVFLTYVLAQLPDGVKGFIIAVIFAAAMSTLSGELGALASASTIDFYKRFAGGAARHDLRVSRVLTAFWGLLACLVATHVGQWGSAIEVVNRLGSYFYGSILGVFALAVLTRWATALGAVCGLVAGMGTVAAVAELTDVHFLWYNVVGAVTVFVVGAAVSLARRLSGH